MTNLQRLNLLRLMHEVKALLVDMDVFMVASDEKISERFRELAEMCEECVEALECDILTDLLGISDD